MDLVNLLLEFSAKRISDKFDCLRDHPFKILNVSEIQKKYIMAILYTFKHQFIQRWNKAQPKKDRLQEDNQEWLGKCVAFTVRETPSTTTLRGQPGVTFNKNSERSKRRKTEDLRSKIATEELVFAAGMGLRSKG